MIKQVFIIAIYLAFQIEIELNYNNHLISRIVLVSKTKKKNWILRTIDKYIQNTSQNQTKYCSTCIIYWNLFRYQEISRTSNVWCYHNSFRTRHYNIEGTLTLSQDPNHYPQQIVCYYCNKISLIALNY